jgi:hypothetical protein
MWNISILFCSILYVLCMWYVSCKFGVWFVGFYCLNVFLKAYSKILPVCLTYSNGKFLHFSQQMPLSSKVSAMCFFFILDYFLSCLWLE